MKRRAFLKTVGTSGLMMMVTPAGLVHAFGRNPEKSLQDGFLDPPATARPHTYWFWMNGHISEEGITRDLEAMKRVGIGGFLNFNCGVSIPKGPVVYLSPEWISLMKHTLKEAERLDLEFGMHNSPGWSSSGGPWITPERSMQTIVWSEQVVKGGSRIKVVLPKPAAKLDYYRDTYVIAFPSSPDEVESLNSGTKLDSTVGDEEETPPSSAANRLQDWQIKAGYKRFKSARMMEPAPFAGGRQRKPFDKGEYVAHEVPQDAIIRSDKIIDLSKYMDASGELNWEAPDGHWTILRFGHAPTGAVNRAAPDTGQGLECDKLSKEAFDMHFNTMFQHLLPAMKSLGDKGKVGIEIDSYEVGMQNWTKGFPAAFAKNRGYEIQKYLPAMTGRVIDSTAYTEAFLWDVRRVIADMVADNYYGRCAELCKKHNFIFYGEPYKLGPFENLQVGSRIQSVMGEFWSRGQRNKHTMKLASSAQHLNGRKIVGAEAYTGMPIYSKWQQYPFSLKAQGDFMFTKGMNKIIFHVYAHQSHPTVRPGMTMGQFGTHIDRNNTWFEQSTAWMNYISRCQFMLQQGLFVADLLYFTGEEGPGEELGTRETPLPEPPVGYDYDNLNTEVLMNRVRVENGRIVLPDNMSYALMILPLKTTMTIPVLLKIRDLVKAGMNLMGAKPQSIPNLSDLKETAQLKKLVSEIWGDLDGKKNTYRTFGLGKVFWEDAVEKVVEKLNLKPDFDFSSKSSDPAINYIHRRDGQADLYFVNNRRRRREHLVAVFRVNGKKPEFWNAVTGEITPAPIYDIINGHTHVPIQLEEAGSVFVVFREQASPKRIIALGKENVALLGLKPLPPKAPKRYAGVLDNFTISAWIKPETDIAMAGMNYLLRQDIASYVCYPSAGENLYGKGHAICGMIAGRNGVAVYERKTEELNPVLQVEIALSGWTHLSLVYKNRQPHIYVNGQLAAKGKASDSIIHPAVGEEYQDKYSVYFEGDMTPAEVLPNALEAAQVAGLMKNRTTGIKKYPAVEVAGSGNQLLIWENGTYSILDKAGKSRSLTVAGVAPPAELSGDWKVTFPPDLGAPPSVVLPALASLHTHADPGVRYFSGTASYHKQFAVTGSQLSGSKRLYLDLGAVEVLAEVIVNGRNLGIIWTRPYRIDITEHVKAGENSLVVKVTNGWPNRLIGDEQLPEEYKYANKDTGGIKVMPDWFVAGKPRPKSDRVAFATWKHYSKDAPLLASGLIGPVTLRTAAIYQAGQ